MLLAGSNKFHNNSNQSEGIAELANAKGAVKQNATIRDVTTCKGNVTKNVTNFVTTQESLQKKDSDSFVTAVTTDLEIENSTNHSSQNSVGDSLCASTYRPQTLEKIPEIACLVADSNLVASQKDPRNAVTIDGVDDSLCGSTYRVVVDEDKLDLNYQPEISIPS